MENVSHLSQERRTKFADSSRAGFGEPVASKIVSKVDDAFLLASKRLSPLWDVRDYVAVNPFFGFRDQPFIETARYLRQYSNVAMLPKRKYFSRKFRCGDISELDLELALVQYKKEQRINEDDDTVTLEHLLEFIRDTDTEIEDVNFRIMCVSDIIDHQSRTNFTETITFEISKWLSAFFDESQSVWRMPKDNLRLYSCWKELVQYDAPLGKQSKEFLQIVALLADDPKEAIHQMSKLLLDEIDLSTEELSNYYYRLIHSILGWSAYIKKFEFEASRSGDSSHLEKIGGLTDIVAIRMAYDLALLSRAEDIYQLKKKKIPKTIERYLNLSYIWLLAIETAYRKDVETRISLHRDTLPPAFKPEVQAVFCIDVRSEILRRHLEKIDLNIQTIGFAGFFALPMSLKGLGHHSSDQNCPVLLNPTIEVCERAGKNEDEIKKKKINFVENIYLKKAIQSSANSGFSFMETMGFRYIEKIVKSSLGKKPNIDLTSLGLNRSEKKRVQLFSEALDAERKTNLALSALKNMGLLKGFAKYVFFFGHGSESANNPYASALDCGACGGHSGQSNAKVLTAILNDKEVRERLRALDVNIPDTTLFLSGWHNTTTDELEIDEHGLANQTQKTDISFWHKKFVEASEGCRVERAEKLPIPRGLSSKELEKELQLRANDWSEVRPEWGLARNASFIVARRDRMRGIHFDGRSFLHDYNFTEDKDLTILELIMTAPMIVTNWINMQYYASTLDPKKFGTGNKVLNNVVGGIGCIQGNCSDLLGGLSEQSVWYKGDYFHEPLRLQVFIEAEYWAIHKIILKHTMLKELVSNNWLRIISISPISGEFKVLSVDT